MLVVSRRYNEWTQIRLEDGRVIWVGIAYHDRDKVRVAIDAPREIRISREELLPLEERRQRQRKESS